MKAAPPRSAEKLLLKLRAHQAEMEMQIEELWQILNALEETCECYADIRERSPVASITLTRQGVISGMNPAAAALFGEERKKLLLRRFMGFVVPEDFDRWADCFVDMLQQKAVKNCELALKRCDGHIFYARLDCMNNIETGGKYPMHITLTAISCHGRAEKQPDTANTVPEIHDPIMAHDADVITMKPNETFTSRPGYLPA